MSSQPALRQIDHRTMRVIVGLIAFFLSPVVWLLAERTLDSISISYWTHAGDVFVGSLTAIAFFLFAYNGTGKSRDLEFWISKIASFFALVIALFPTDGFPDGGSYVPANWVSAVAGILHLEVKTIHFGAALLFFGCLVALIFFFAVRAEDKGHAKRALAYRGVGGLIVAGIVGGAGAIFVFEIPGALFYTEWWALAWFGIGWFLAGSYHDDDQAAAATP